MSASSAADRLLHPGDVGVLRELEHARGPEVAAGADGDVVDHDRHRARGGDRLEVRDDAGLRRAHVVRARRSAWRRARACRRSASTAAIGLRGAVGARADDQLRAALGADRARTRRSPRAARRRRAPTTRRWCRGRRCPAQPASRYSWQRRVDRVEGDRAVGRERGDERDVDALEQTALGRSRAARVPRRPARGPGRKTASIIGSVSLPVNVFCCSGGSSRARRTRRSPPRARGRTSVAGAGSGEPARGERRGRRASYANPPSTTIDAHPVEQRELAFEVRAGSGRAPSGVGLLAGGAQRTAAAT